MSRNARRREAVQPAGRPISWSSAVKMQTAKKRTAQVCGPAKVIQLPLWPEPKRGAPNAVLRGALFAAIQGKGRRYRLGT